MITSNAFPIYKTSINEQIILDALKFYKEWIENDDHAPSLDSFPYSLLGIDLLIKEIEGNK